MRQREVGYFKELRVAADGNEKWFWQYGELPDEDAFRAGLLRRALRRLLGR